jgi:hypothetical protein
MIKNECTDTTLTFPKHKADEFFKHWRQRKDKNGEPWADKQMGDANREVLEELGFPPLTNQAGQEFPRGSCTHSETIKLQSMPSYLTHYCCSYS